MPNPPVAAEVPSLSDPLRWDRSILKGSVLIRGLFLFSPVSLGACILTGSLLAILWGRPETAWASDRTLTCRSLSPEIVVARYIKGHSRPALSFLVSWKIGKLLVRSSRESSLPLYLLVALAQQESSFNPQAINESTGDYGLFEVHYPFWRMFFRKRVGKILSRLRPEDLLDASVNARVASMILSYDMKLSGGIWSRCWAATLAEPEQNTRNTFQQYFPTVWNSSDILSPFPLLAEKTPRASPDVEILRIYPSDLKTQTLSLPERFASYIILSARGISSDSRETSSGKLAIPILIVTGRSPG